MKRTILFASLLCVLISIPALAAGGTLPGAGTEANPYLIEDLADFDIFADPNNASIYWAAGVHTQLMTDIDLSGYDGQDGRPEFQRIGTSRYSGAFSGIFDGNGHTISNLTLNLSDTSYVGLFGCVEGDSPEVKNIRLINVNILAQNDVGGLIGWNGGTVSNCFSNGVVTGSGSYIGGFIGENSHGSIIDCYSKGSVTGAGNHVGGLVGLNEFGMINNCYFNGHVEGGSNVGGLIGWNYSPQLEVSDCYSAGSVTGDDTVGGLIGGNSGVIDSCYSTSSVLGVQDVGGLGGYNYQEIIRCYSTGGVSGTNNVGGFLGGGGINDRDSQGHPSTCFWNHSVNPGLTGLPYGDDIPGLEGKTTAEIMTQSTFTNWDFSDMDGDPADWKMLRPGEDTPRLTWQEEFDGDIAGLYGVDMVDFAYLANYWGTGCNSGTDCGRADIDDSGGVGLGDLAAVAADWLKW